MRNKQPSTQSEIVRATENPIVQPISRRCSRGLALHRAPLAAFLAATLIVPARADAPSPKSPLADGWERAVPILLSKPAPEGKTFRTVRGHVIASVEKGWVVVRRETVDRDLEWQVVLAQATDPAEPKLRIDETTGSLEVTYRRYFIRETADGERLRVFRERKNEGMPEWPVVEFKDPESPGAIGGSSGNPYVRTRGRSYWCWVEAGAVSTRPDLYVRLRPATRRPLDSRRTYDGEIRSGLTVALGGPVEMSAGDSLIQEEGDLFFAIRATEVTAAQGMVGPSLAQWFKDNRVSPDDAPPLTARTWLNDDTRRLNEQSKGAVTIVGFWDREHAPSVNSLARLEELHRKYAARGVAVVGVHVPGESESDTARRTFLSQRGVTFPVMVDQPSEKGSWYVPGKTVRAYFVDVLPAFFLIDKAGTIVRGYGLTPPTDEQVEALLK